MKKRGISLLLLVGVVATLGLYIGLDWMFHTLRPDIGTVLEGHTGLDPITYAFSIGAPFIIVNTGALVFSAMFITTWTLWVLGIGNKEKGGASGSSY